MKLSARLAAALACLLLMTGSLAAVLTEVASLRGFLYGLEPGCAYDNWVSHLAEEQISWLNIYAPWEGQNDDFGDFHIATSEDLANWGSVFDSFLALDLDGAQARLEQFGFPFQVVNFQDLDSGRNLYMIRELLNEDLDTNGTEDAADDETGSFDYGWGLYLYNPYASRPLVITAPHPCDDYPSPVFALEAFLQLDARFLMINGAGREVAYFPPYYSNNQSISDPSRMADHPLNIAYQRSTEQLRGLTGKTEFSLQIHSYDWNKYPGQPNVMLSAGNGRNFPALPIRDDSRGRHDLINHTPWLVHPQNTLGTHSEVDILDFYCVNYDYYEPAHYQHDGELVQVPRNTELPGAEFNQQMLMTGQQNLYDVYSPFLHVEMDELPKCYERNEANWRWFFGYDATAQSWDLGQRYTRFIEFYQPWLDALYEVIDSMLVLDDGTGPTNPENLRLTALGNQDCSFAWDRSYSYDFDSYVIHLRHEQDGAEVNQIFDRHTNPELAWQNRSSFSLDLGPEYRVYYLRVQARDKHGNSSPFSNELKVWKVINPITQFSAIEGDGMIDLSFSTNPSAPLGYNIYRAEGSGGFTLLASWREYPDLLPNPSFVYSFLDQTAQNGSVYRYQVSAEYAGGQELFHWRTLTASPYRKYALTLHNTQLGISHSLYIGLNPLASDALDLYDAEQQSTSGPLLILTPAIGEDGPFNQDIRATFDQASDEKVWDIQYRSTQTAAQLTLIPDPALLAAGAEILLFDVESAHWHDLRLSPYAWTSQSTDWQQLRLVWGRQQPLAQFPPAPDLFQWLGTPLDLNWEVVNQPRVSSVDVYLCGAVDSLLVAAGLPPQITQWSYVPELPISGTRLLVQINCRDGSVSPHYSEQRFSIVPPNIGYGLHPGFGLLSLPASGNSYNLAELLGNSASAWVLDADAAWQPVQTLSPGQGYLVSVTQGTQIALPAAIPVGPVTFGLQPGWNLLPNPLNHHFELRNLLFNHASQVKDHAQMVADSLLLPFAYALDASGYALAEGIAPGQAVLLNYLGSSPASVVLDPQRYEGQPLAWDEEWSVRLSVSDGYHSGDAVLVGAADLSSPGFDPLFDLPKAPPLPGSQHRLSLLQADPQSGLSRCLQSEYQGLYPWYAETEKTWRFELQSSSLAPLRLDLEAPGLPASYSVDVCIFGHWVSFASLDQIWFDPPSSGVHEGWIRIRSYTPNRGSTPKADWIGISPNPFNDQVTLDLSRIRGDKVSAVIYNSRGQKVRELLSGRADTNRTSLLWDARDELGQPVAPGVYLLRVTTSAGTATRKLVRY